jgi:propionyl-CoA carboxylase alpha chain
MLAKVIAWAPSRPEAAGLLARELDRTVLVGATTNRDLLVGVLRDEAFLAGATTTSFLPERFPDGVVPGGGTGQESARTAMIAAVLDRAVASRAATGVLPALRAGFTNTASFEPHAVVEVEGSPWTVRYRCERDGSWWVQLVPGDELEGGEPHPQATEHRVTVHVAGHRHLDLDPRVRDRTGGVCPVDLEVDGHRQLLTLARHACEVHVRTADGRVVVHERPRFPVAEAEEVAGATLAPMPGAVVAVAVAEGDAVAQGDLLVTVEAMKMEHRITAPFAGTVAEVRVAAGQQVDAEQVLVVIGDADLV